MKDVDAVDVKVERVGLGGGVARNAEVLAMHQRRELPKRSRPASSLLERLMVRQGSMKPMPDEVRRKAPKRVQEAMKVVEDYVGGLDEKGGA